MLYPVHSKILFYYRLLFIALFLLLGVSGAGIVIMQYYIGIDIITAETTIDHQALFATASIMGALGFFTALIMIFLMREKRGFDSDRRLLNRPLDFTDRRSTIDRRSKLTTQAQRQHQ